MKATDTLQTDTGTPPPGSIKAVELGCICKAIRENGQDQMYIRNDCPVHWREILIGRVVQIHNVMQINADGSKKRDNELAFLYKVLIAAAVIGCILSFKPF